MAQLIPWRPEDRTRSLTAEASLADAQRSLLPTRVSTRYPGFPIGKSIEYICAADDGFTYFCKADVNHRPVRATEWIAQSIATHLSIAVPEFRVIEQWDRETLFGSRQPVSTASVFEVQDYLTRLKRNEFGGPTEWFGRWLSGLYVFDMFLNNPDRTIHNFVLEQTGSGGRLKAIDFADARLEDLTSDSFPVATSNTVCNGEMLERVHGFFPDSASEMIEKIRLIPVPVIEGIVRGMPDDWMADDQRCQICDAWAGNRINARLSALRAGIENGPRR